MYIVLKVGLQYFFCPFVNFVFTLLHWILRFILKSSPPPTCPSPYPPPLQDILEWLEQHCSHLLMEIVIDFTHEAA